MLRWRAPSSLRGVRLVIPDLALASGVADHVEALVRQLGGSGTQVIRAKAPPARRPHDVVLLPTPYLAEHFDEPWSERVLESRTAYVGYGLNGICDWPEGEYDLPLFSEIDYLCASSTEDVQRFVAGGAIPEHARWTGNPLLYEARRLATPSLAQAPTVLWAPHWTRFWVDGRAGFSNWHFTVHDLLNAANRRPQLRVIVRAHPYLQPTRRGSNLPDYASDLWADVEFDHARSALDALLKLPQVTLSTETMLTDLERSTHVLTDGISILGYSLGAGRPTALVRRHDSPPLGPSGKTLSEACAVLAPGDATRRWLASVADAHGGDWRPEAVANRKRLVQEAYPVHNESPGMVLQDWIRSTVKDSRR